MLPVACVGLGLKAKAFQAAIKGSGKGERCLGVGGNGERRQVESRQSGVSDHGERVGRTAQLPLSSAAGRSKRI